MANPLTGVNTPGTHDMALSLLKFANREKIAQALTERGYSVKRVTVNRWAAGSEMPPIAAKMILELFGHASDATKEPPPEWARALPGEVAAAVIERLAEIPEIAQAAAVELGLAAPRPDEPSSAEDAMPRGTGHTALPPPGRRV